MSELERIKSFKPRILEIAKKYNVTEIFVFGSTVRAETAVDSDVDLLVSFGPGMSLLRHAALERELDELIGKKVDVVSRKGLRERVRQNILKEALPL